MQGTPVQCKRHWFGPWSRKIPQDAEQLSPCTTTTKPIPVSCNFWAHTPRACALQWEATAVRSLCIPNKDEALLTTTRESPCAATKTHHSQVKKSKKKKKKKSCDKFAFREKDIEEEEKRKGRKKRRGVFSNFWYQCSNNKCEALSGLMLMSKYLTSYTKTKRYSTSMD